MFTHNIQELYKFHALLLVWSMRKIHVRYKQSILGGIWAVLQPFSSMLIFTFIFVIKVYVSKADAQITHDN